MEKDSKIHGLRFGRETLSISYLLFPNDSFIFMNANKDDAKVLCDVLKFYGDAFGQLVNFDKSEVCFGKGVTNKIRDEVADFYKLNMWSVMKNIWAFLPLRVGARKIFFLFIKKGCGTNLVIGIVLVFWL